MLDGEDQETSQTIQPFAIGLGCLPQPKCKYTLLKAPCALDIGIRRFEIELILAVSTSFHGSREAMCKLPREGSNLQLPTQEPTQLCYLRAEQALLWQNICQQKIVKLTSCW